MPVQVFPAGMLARAENAVLSTRLMNESITQQGIKKGQLTIHADRGSPMIAKPPLWCISSLISESPSRILDPT